jgi:hypothetical protein
MYSGTYILEYDEARKQKVIEKAKVLMDNFPNKINKFQLLFGVKAVHVEETAKDGRIIFQTPKCMYKILETYRQLHLLDMKQMSGATDELMWGPK